MGSKIVESFIGKRICNWNTPLILDMNVEKDVTTLKTLSDEGKITYVADATEEAIEELYHIQYPAQIDKLDDKQFASFAAEFGSGDTDCYGFWVYFPWNGVVVHFPTQEDLGKLRGSRNRNLITDTERLTLSNNKTILILGLSVGSNVVDSLLMQGIGSRYILVDMDTLGPTNLNRIRSSYDQLGVHKVDVVAKKISELDPYIQQVHYKDGINETNLEEILQKYRPDIIVDEMDSLRMKVVIRQRARAESIPVLMATDDGDDILLDIERFDLDNQQPILHGVLPQSIVEDILANKKMSRQESGAIIGKYFVGLHNVPIRMMESLLEVGRTLPSWPQLGAAAVLSGLYVAYAAKKILLGQPINAGRFLMGPDEQLNPEIKTDEYQKRKALLIERMMQGRPGAS